MSGILHIALLLLDFLNTQLFIVWSSVNNTLIDRQKVRKCTPSRTVAAVEFLPESAGYDSDRIHCMTCRTTITTPSLRAVVSLTPSLRIMITTPSNSNINTLTVNLQQVSTQLRWTPITGMVNTMKEQDHPFVVLTPRTAVIEEPQLPRLLPAS